MSRHPFDERNLERSRNAQLQGIAAQVRGELEDIRAMSAKEPGRAVQKVMTTVLALVRLADERPTKKSKCQAHDVAMGFCRMLISFQGIGGKVIFTDPKTTETKDGKDSGTT